MTSAGTGSAKDGKNTSTVVVAAAAAAAAAAGGAEKKGTEVNVDGMNEDEDRFPEPAQVVARYFTMQASDLVLRVSDLDVAVLVTMAKSIVRVRERVGPRRRAE